MKAIVVGCGLCGSVVARQLADKGWNVEIWERRGHIGGNMFDYKDEHGFIVQKYGPHVFHTNDRDLIEYIKRFTKWQDYHLRCGAVIDGKCVPMPFNFKTIDNFYTHQKANELKSEIKRIYAERSFITVVEALSSESSLIREYAEFLFEKDYSLYTAKQWGIPPDKIDPSVLKRVPLKLSYNEGYFEDKFQVMPASSFTTFFESLLNHPSIEVKLHMDALKLIKVVNDKIENLDGETIKCPIIYTGALDELFNLSEGALPYRSLRFEWLFATNDSFQEYPVVAYPQAEGFTRITEFKKLQPQTGVGSSYAIEFPIPYSHKCGSEPYYPVLTFDSANQYNKYMEKAQQIDNFFCCGRLADFKYYNMDQALRRALDVAELVYSSCKHI